MDAEEKELKKISNLLSRAKAKIPEWLKNPVFVITGILSFYAIIFKAWNEYFCEAKPAIDTLTVLYNKDQSHFWIIVLIPVLTIFLYLCRIGYTNWRKHFLRRPVLEDTKEDYFHTHPLDYIPKSWETFRSDNEHEKVLKWLTDANKSLLYLIGQSGTGKSTILDAYVIPKLINLEPSFKAISLRNFSKPLESLKLEMKKIGISIETENENISSIVDLINFVSCKIDPQKLLVVFDQFEQFLRIPDEESEPFSQMIEFLNRMEKEPIKGVTVLLSFRSDFIGRLKDFSLPTFSEPDNGFSVDAFSDNEAKRFLHDSDLGFTERNIDSILNQISYYEGSEGYNRPILLNMIGIICSESQRMQRRIQSRLSQNPVIEYIRNCVYHRNLRDHAPKILDYLMLWKSPDVESTQVLIGNAKPLEDIAKQTSIPAIEVQNCLAHLEHSGIVRALDDRKIYWEISHDFIAHYLNIVLRIGFSSVREKILKYLPLGLMIAWIIVITVTMFNQKSDIEENKMLNARMALIDLGADVNKPDSYDEIFFMIVTEEHKNMFFQHLKEYNQFTPVRSLFLPIGPSNNISFTSQDLCKLEFLSALEELHLSFNKITDLTQFPNLENLQQLSLKHNNISVGLDRLVVLKNLEILDLSFNKSISYNDLGFLSDLESLTLLILDDSQITQQQAAELEAKNTNIKVSIR